MRCTKNLSQDEYRKLIQSRYQRAKKAVKQKILDEFCRLFGYHRKYAIALLKKPARIKKKAHKKVGRKPYYHDETFVKALQHIWHQVDLMCSTRLKAAIPLWLPYYSKHYEKLMPEIEQKLLTISTATIDRVLKPTRDSLEIRRRSQTRPGTILQKQIPYKLDINWDPMNTWLCGSRYRGALWWQCFG